MIIPKHTHAGNACVPIWVPNLLLTVYDKEVLIYGLVGKPVLFFGDLLVTMCDFEFDINDNVLPIMLHIRVYHSCGVVVIQVKGFSAVCLFHLITFHILYRHWNGESSCHPLTSDIGLVSRRQAMSHFMSRCWPRSMSSYGVTRPQWININLAIITETSVW